MSVKATPNEETLTLWQRFGDVLVIFAMLLLFAALLYLQVADTGFFTEAFGRTEMFLLYGPLLASLAAPAIRALGGHRNPARPFEAAASLFLGVGSLWLLVVFPFDFPRLADTLPTSMEYMLSWVTNDIGRIPLILQVIIGPITAAAVTWKFISYSLRAA